MEEKQAIIKQKEQEENQQSDGDGTNDDGSIGRTRSICNS